MPIPVEDATNGEIGDIIQLQDKLYAVLYIQNENKPQNYLYSFDLSLNFLGALNLTDHKTRENYGFLSIIGINSTIFLFSTELSKTFLTYDINSGEVVSHQLSNVDYIISTFSDGVNLFLVVRNGHEGVCVVNPTTLQCESFQEIIYPEANTQLKVLLQCKIAPYLNASIAYCYGSIHVKGINSAFFSVSTTSWSVINEHPNVDLKLAYTLASEGYSGEALLWTEWENTTGAYLSALNENMELMWSKGNIIFPVSGIVNVGNSIILADPKGIHVFNGETGDHLNTYTLPDDYIMVINNGFPTPIISFPSLQTFYSISYKRSLGVLHPIYWSRIEISN